MAGGIRRARGAVLDGVNAGIEWQLPLFRGLVFATQATSSSGFNGDGELVSGQSILNSGLTHLWYGIEGPARKRSDGTSNYLYPWRPAYNFGQDDFTCALRFMPNGTPWGIGISNSTDSLGWALYQNRNESAESAYAGQFLTYDATNGIHAVACEGYYQTGKFSWYVGLRRAGALELWRNGVLMASKTAPAVIRNVNGSGGTNRVGMGYSSYNSIGYWRTGLAWNRAILPAEIFELVERTDLTQRAAARRVGVFSAGAVNYVGSAAGSSTADGISGSVAAGAGTSSAAAAAGSVAAAAGVSVPAAQSGAVGSSAGSSAGSARSGVVGAAAGTSSATSLSGSVAQASGVGQASAYSGTSSVASAVGTSAGQALSGSVGQATGTSTAAGYSSAASIAAAAGSSSGLAIAGFIAQATGQANAIAVRGSVAQAVGSSAGNAVSSTDNAATGSAAGAGVAIGVSGATGRAAGASLASAVSSMPGVLLRPARACIRARQPAAVDVRASMLACDCTN